MGDSRRKVDEFQKLMGNREEVVVAPRGHQRGNIVVCRARAARRTGARMACSRRWACRAAAWARRAWGPRCAPRTHPNPPLNSVSEHPRRLTVEHPID